MFIIVPFSIDSAFIVQLVMGSDRTLDATSNYDMQLNVVADKIFSSPL
jgi:hypothetical protein